MEYLSVKDAALKWGISERSVRHYCSEGRLIGAILNGKTWQIPIDAAKPPRKDRKTYKEETLSNILKREKENKISGGIYHKLQIEMTYNSNHIEGNKLTHDQTRYIYETKTINIDKNIIKVDDIIETSNHFRCIDLVIDSIKSKLNESLIKQLHYTLMAGTSKSSEYWFNIGNYKILENEVGGIITTTPLEVKYKIKELLNWYNSINKITINDIIEFHYRFECIHPFADGNGRVGRLIMLKECLKNNIVPILITDEYKLFYYHGLKEWNYEKGYLIDTCLNGQDIFKKYLDSFKINYKN